MINKPVGNLPVPAKGRDLTRHLCKMFMIAMEGPKLKAIKSSVICGGFAVAQNCAIGVRGRNSAR